MYDLQNITYPLCTRFLNRSAPDPMENGVQDGPLCALLGWYVRLPRE